MYSIKPQSKNFKSVRLSGRRHYNCRKCSVVLIFMALLQVATMGNTSAQGDINRWQPINQWLQDNLTTLGGRAILLVHDSNGNIIYSHSESNLLGTPLQTGKLMAYRRGKGLDAETAAFDENSRQRIASCSKWLTAALVMTFVDEGRLKLTDTIGTWLPIMTTHGKGNITIAQCLSHLTGIHQEGIGAVNESKTGLDTAMAHPSNRQKRLQKWQLATNAKQAVLFPKINPWNSMSEAMENIAIQPMEGSPGKSFHYGNAGLQIASAIMEKIGGNHFETLFKQRIAIPCGMIHTDFGQVKVPLAAGGAFSTPTDYINFLQMLLNKGRYNGKQVLSASSIAAMQVNYTQGATVMFAPKEAGNWGYGFGEWVIETAGATAISVSSPGLFGSFPWVDNSKGYCAFLFTYNLNSKGRNERYLTLKSLVDQAVATQ